MYKLFRSFLVLAIVVWVSAPARAATPDPDPAPTADDYSQPAIFQFVTDLTPPGETKLANGVIVKASDWPTIIAADILKRTTPGKKAPICTGTFVGPNVVLMAAHCIDNPLTNIPRGAKVVIGPRTLDLECSPPQAYLARDMAIKVPRSSEDFALCLLLDDKVTPTQLSGLRFEVVDVSAPPAKDERVLMTGYGCSEVRNESGLVFNDRDGELRIANQIVATVPGAASPKTAHYLGFASKGKEAMLCPGDSGGPLFTGATTDEPNGQRVTNSLGRSVVLPRRVRGVNSMIDPPRSDGVILSNVAATGTGFFKTWAEKWIVDNSNHPKASKPIICGVNRDAGRAPCRS